MSPDDVRPARLQIRVRASFVGLLVFPILVSAGAAAGQVRVAALRIDAPIQAPDTVDLDRVREVRQARRGDLYVTIGDPPSILVFGPNGRLIRTVGRSGRGPGEFGYVTWIGWRADSFWVIDNLLRRVSVFGDVERGANVYTRQVPSVAARRMSMRTDARAILADGSVLLTEYWYPPDREFVQATGYLMLRASRGGTVVDTVATLSYGNSWLVAPFDGASGQLETVQPWATRDLVAVSVGGDRVAIVERPPARHRGSAAYHVRIYSSMRAERQSVEVSYDPLLLPDSAVERYVTNLAQQGGTGFSTEAAARRAIREALFRPPFYPPAVAAFFGSDGTLWVQREDSAGVRRWDVFDPSGRRSLQVRGPTDVEVLAANGAVAWAVRRSQDGAQLLRCVVDPR